ncbi:MAG: alpha/beta hydrolase, partial [Gammaproteobacteria bacterium]
VYDMAMNDYPGLILLLALLASCTQLQDRSETALAIAGGGGLVRQVLDAGQFRLTLFHRGFQEHTDTIAIYIEGDGFAWKQKHHLSADPTPVDPLALNLAAKDPAPAVLYIARPCQYLGPEELEKCHPKYWSSHRYAEEVIHAVNEAVDWGVRKAGAARVYLYGYSGGGVVAALVAARRTEVTRLITIAANLDHVLWTSQHGISPLSGSLNPADETDKLQNLNQVHFAGSADRIVPVNILESYRARYGKNVNITIHIIPGFDHHCCWVDSWPELLVKAETGLKPGKVPDR